MDKSFNLENKIKLATIAAQLVVAKSNDGGTSLRAVLKDFDEAFAHVEKKM